MAIIAISRQMGSGGYTIAAAVAKALGYEYADRQMIANAAKAYDVPETAIAEVAERRLSHGTASTKRRSGTVSFWMRLISALRRRTTW